MEQVDHAKNGLTRRSPSTPSRCRTCARVPASRLSAESPRPWTRSSRDAVSRRSCRQQHHHRRKEELGETRQQGRLACGGHRLGSHRPLHDGQIRQDSCVVQDTRRRRLHSSDRGSVDLPRPEEACGTSLEQRRHCTERVRSGRPALPDGLAHQEAQSSTPKKSSAALRNKSADSASRDRAVREMGADQALSVTVRRVVQAGDGCPIQELLPVVPEVEL